MLTFFARCSFVPFFLLFFSFTLGLSADLQAQHHGHEHHGSERRPLTPQEIEELARLKREIPPPSEQNLDFEDGDNSAPWILGGRGYSKGLDTEVAQSGKRSLRIRYEESGRFAVASLPFDAKTVRGKRLRLTGYLKTEDVAQGHAGLWMRVDIGSQMAAFDNMDRRGVSGDTPWTQYRVELDVPEEATRIFYGAVLTGIGTLWVDNVTIEGIDVEPPELGSLKGRLAGENQVGGLAALARDGEVVRSTETDSEGRFTFDGIEVGTYRISATGPAGPASASVHVTREGASVTLEPSAPWASVKGTLHGPDGKPTAGAELEATAWSSDSAETFAVRTDAEGRYAAPLPAAEAITVRLTDDATAAVGRILDPAEGSEETLDLWAHSRTVPKKGLIADFIDGAVVLATTHPTQPVGEMQDVATLVGDARVVGLGESAPGTHELFEMKHRLTRLLLEEKGFDRLALPVSSDAATRIDRFIRSGEGEPSELLAQIGSWTWQTEDALVLLQELRKTAQGDRSIQILGYGDDPAALASELETEPEAKMVVWGHNRQITRFSADGPSLGALLAKAFGERYVAMGGFFHQGAFRAVGRAAEGADSPARFWLGPASRQHLEYLFANMGGKLSVQDLRHYDPEGEVGRWLSVPRPLRDIDSRYWGESAADRSIVLTDHFDALFFVESVTRSIDLGEPQNSP